MGEELRTSTKPTKERQIHIENIRAQTSSNHLAFALHKLPQLHLTATATLTPN